MSNRPGLASPMQLDEDVRRVIEPLNDIVARVTALGDVTALDKISGFAATDLDPAAATATIVARVNDHGRSINVLLAKVNQIIARLQED